MRQQTFLAAAVVVALLAATSSAGAADTIRLGGIGSTAERFAADAPAMTLKGLPNDDATFEQAHLVRRFAYGVGWAATHPFGGYFRPYYGYYRPWAYRPWYGYGFYRPWYYRPWYGYYRPWGGYYRPWYGISYASAPALAGDYGTPAYVETLPAATAVAQPCLPAAGVAVRPEPLPAPVRPAVRPIPAPAVVPPATVPPPVLDEPLSGRRATTTRVATEAKKKLTYPAYGEPPARPGEGANSVLVNSTRH